MPAKKRKADKPAAAAAATNPAPPAVDVKGPVPDAKGQASENHDEAECMSTMVTSVMGRWDALPPERQAKHTANYTKRLQTQSFESWLTGLLPTAIDVSRTKCPIVAIIRISRMPDVSDIRRMYAIDSLFTDMVMLQIQSIASGRSDT